MEIWDIYDKYRNRTGKTTSDKSKLGKEGYHLVVHICIFNSKGEMLVQQRQSNSKHWGDHWDLSAGGSALSGELSYETAERETLEEIGIKLDLKNIRPHLSLNFPRGFDDVFLIEKDIEIENLVLQEEEVKDIKWASREDIVKMIEDDEFVPYYISYINMLFDIRKSYRTHTR